MHYKIITFLEPIRAEVTGQPGSLKSKERDTFKEKEDASTGFSMVAHREKDVRLIRGRERAKEIFEEVKMENFLKIVIDNKA